MSKSKQARARSSMALGVVLVAAAALMLVWGRGNDGSAQAQGLPATGMTLGGPSTAEPGVPFVITVNAGPAPSVDVSGFNTEVVFGELEWTPRADCLDEVQVTAGGGPPSCTVQDQAVTPLGQARHVVWTAIQIPPLPPLDALSDGDPLLELDVQCPAEGTYSVVLTAVSQDPAESAPFGAVYFDLSSIPIFVEPAGTQDIDLEGDTVAETVVVADTLDVTCEEAPEEASPVADMSPPETGTGSGAYGGDGSGLWATIGALLAAAAAGLVIFGWRYARSRP